MTTIAETPIEGQLKDLRGKCPGAAALPLPTGGHLITIPNHRMPRGWNRDVVTILFLAPPGYPAAQPDCFWVEPGGVRLENNSTPQGTNDTNPIPGVGPRGTWFSWHLQGWNPNVDSFLRYFRAIQQRLDLLK
jgi:hypothetical protein